MYSEHILVVTDNDFQIQWINNNALYFFEVEQADVKGQFLGELLSYSKETFFKQWYQGDLCLDKPKSIEIKLPSGKRRYASIVFMKSVKEDRPGVWEYNVVLEDLSFKRILDWAQTQDHQFKDSLLLFKMLAHEMRNPLGTSMLATSELAQLIKEAGLDEKHVVDIENCMYYLDVLRRSLQRITNQINALLALPEDRKLKEFERIDLVSVLKSAYSATIDNIDVNDIELDQQLLDEPIYIQGDREMLIMAFNNMIVNAIHALASQKQPYIKIKMWREGTNVLVSVEDNGEGMSPNLIQQFLDEESSTLLTNGVGLATIKSILQRHNAQVSLQSSNQGTTYKILFKTSYA